MRIIHKIDKHKIKDEYVWWMFTRCKKKVQDYKCSFYWKDVTCKNCLRSNK